MLNEVLKGHLLNQIGDEIKGKQYVDAKAIVAGEIYMRQRHLAEAQQQEERLNDEIVELRKFNVNAELEKQKG